MPRRALSALLLAFVLVSLGVLAVRARRAASQWRPAAAAPANPPATTPSARHGSIVAYYFHVTVRCTTCRAIESQSKEVIHDRFAPELASGRLTWRLVNVQLPENRHFVQDYQLVTRSLVLVHLQNGRQIEYKVLHDTWELVGDKAALQRYVESEVRAFLGKLS